MTSDEMNALGEVARQLGQSMDDPAGVLAAGREEECRLSDIVASRLTNKILLRSSRARLDALAPLLVRLKDARPPVPGSTEGSRREISPEPPARTKYWGYIELVYGLNRGPERIAIEHSRSYQISGVPGDYAVEGGEVRLPDPDGRIKGNRVRIDFDAQDGRFDVYCQEGGLPVWLNRSRLGAGQHLAVDGASGAKTYLFIPTVKKIVLRLTAQGSP